jgi:hypothetical protein
LIEAAEWLVGERAGLLLHSLNDPNVTHGTIAASTLPDKPVAHGGRKSGHGQLVEHQEAIAFSRLGAPNG